MTISGENKDREGERGEEERKGRETSKGLGGMGVGGGVGEGGGNERREKFIEIYRWLIESEGERGRARERKTSLIIIRSTMCARGRLRCAGQSHAESIISLPLSLPLPLPLK